MLSCMAVAHTPVFLSNKPFGQVVTVIVFSISSGPIVDNSHAIESSLKITIGQFLGSRFYSAYVRRCNLNLFIYAQIMS